MFLKASCGPFLTLGSDGSGLDPHLFGCGYYFTFLVTIPDLCGRCTLDTEDTEGVSCCSLPRVSLVQRDCAPFIRTVHC